MKRRRTQAEIAKLEDAALDILGADRPQSVRHVFYRLVVLGLVEKTDAGYQQVVNRLTKLRRSGRLPYGWISDATRSGHHVATDADGGAFLQRVARFYRADLWRNCPERVEVWVESRSIAGVILRTCQDLAVSLYPCGGFPSMTLAYNAAEQIGRSGKEGAVVLYVGDHDPAGLHIDAALERELRLHLEPHGMALSFQRLAVTAGQIAEHGLPTKPRKAGERRRPDIQETVEAEALPASALRQIVRESVEAHLLPHLPGGLDAVRLAEASEREMIAAIGATWDDDAAA